MGEVGVDFGERLRSLRLSRGASQRDLASKAGLDPTYVSKVERGAYRPPKVSTIRRIARALALDPPDERALLAASGRLPAETSPAGARGQPALPLDGEQAAGERDAEPSLGPGPSALLASGPDPEGPHLTWESKLAAATAARERGRVAQAQALLLGALVDLQGPRWPEDRLLELADRLERVADRLEAADRLDLPAPEQEFGDFARANQEAARANAVEAAWIYLELAMRVLDRLPDTAANRRRRLELLVKQGQVANLLLKFREYHELLTRYEPAAVGLDDPGLLAAYHMGKAWSEWSFGRFDRSRASSLKAIELGSGTGNAEVVGVAYVNLEWTHLYLGQFDQALEFRARVRGQVPDGHPWAFYAAMAAALAHTWRGRWMDALRECQGARLMAVEFGDSSMLSLAAWLGSLAHTYQGDLEQAVGFGELALLKSVTPLDRVGAQGHLACAWIRQGRLSSGIQILAEVLPEVRAAQFIGSEYLALFLAEGYRLSGQYEQAAQALEEHLEIVRGCGMRFCIGSAHRLLGEIALDADPGPAGATLAAHHFEQSIAVLREIGAENELALAYAGYGRLHKRLGELARAREYLTEALGIFDRLGTLIEPDRVRRELASVGEAGGATAERIPRS
jgi:transcriptional regulator with XRE-family HTH domain